MNLRNVCAVFSSMDPVLICNSRQFELIVAGLILFNAIAIGISTDWAMKNLAEKPPFGFRVMDLFFAFAFTAELSLRLLAERTFFFSRQNDNISWNAFDSLLVCSALIEEVLGFIETANIDMSAMRVLRIMRLVRVLRIVRMMRVFSDLRKMVTGIASSLRSLMWCLLLLVLIMFTFGVCIMQIAGDNIAMNKQANGEGWLPNENEDMILDLFGNLFRTILTLYMCIVGGLDWSDASDPLTEIHTSMGILFAIYIAFAVLCVLNIVTGVFVENATRITQQGDTNAIMDELAIRHMWTDEVQYLFNDADEDHNGELDWKEFEHCLEDERIQNFFKSLGLSLDDESVFALFQLLDFDGNGTVEMDEFVEGCTHVHGNARSLDMVRLRHENKNLQKEMTDLKELCQKFFAGQDPGFAEPTSRSSTPTQKRKTVQKGRKTKRASVGPSDLTASMTTMKGSMTSEDGRLQSPESPSPVPKKSRRGSLLRLGGPKPGQRQSTGPDAEQQFAGTASAPASSWAASRHQNESSGSQANSTPVKPFKKVEAQAANPNSDSAARSQGTTGTTVEDVESESESV